MPTHDDRVDIAIDDEHIAGTLITPAAAFPGVLFVHGWGGTQEQYLGRAREIAALGCFCLTFDLRGHARTKPRHDTVTREDNLRDVMAAYDLLVAQRNIDRTAIAVVGSSYGGYLAAILTSLRPVKWLALRAPALYKDAGWTLPKVQLNQDADLHAYRRRALRADEDRALKACSAFRGDVLIVESEQDTIVPHPAIANYVAACAAARSLTYRVIGSADHGLSEQSWQQAYTALLVNWLTEMVIGAREGGLARQHVAPAPQEAPPKRA